MKKRSHEIRVRLPGPQTDKGVTMKKYVIFCLLVMAGFALSSCTSIKDYPISYTTPSGDTILRGYIAYDDSIKGKRPGILVVHEWWGLNDYARKRARMLAKLGYTALAVDMYGDGKQAAHPKEAQAFAEQVMKNLDEERARFVAALELLKSQESVDPERIGAIGYCFGGGVVLQMAREGLDLDGVVSFHGLLTTTHPAVPGKFKGKIMVAHGADDAFNTPEQVAAFKAEMEAAHIPYTFIVYPNAKHSFTNPDADKYAKEFGIPVGYNKAADKKSWNDMKKFFKEIFAKK